MPILSFSGGLANSRMEIKGKIELMLLYMYRKHIFFLKKEFLFDGIKD